MTQTGSGCVSSFLRLPKAIKKNSIKEKYSYRRLLERKMPFANLLYGLPPPTYTTLPWQIAQHRPIQ